MTNRRQRRAADRSRSRGAVRQRAVMPSAIMVDAAGRRVYVDNSMVVTWMVAMHPQEAPPNRHVEIPARLLPAGHRATANFLQFLEEHIHEFEERDTPRAADPEPQVQQPFVPFQGTGYRLDDLESMD